MLLLARCARTATTGSSRSPPVTLLVCLHLDSVSPSLGRACAEFTDGETLAVAWAGLGYFALYLSGKMHLFDHRGYTVKAWVAIAPLIGATLIAVSRTRGESLFFFSLSRL